MTHPVTYNYRNIQNNSLGVFSPVGKVFEFKKVVGKLSGCWHQEYYLCPHMYNLTLNNSSFGDHLPEGASATLHPGNAARRLLNDQLLRVLALSPRDMREAVFVTPQKIIKLEYTYKSRNNFALFTRFLKDVSYHVDKLGAVVLDNLGMRCWYPEEWLGVIENGPFELRNHLTIHTVPEGSTRRFWIHTHGMTQFACPDLEVRMVSEEGKEAAMRLLLRLIRYQIRNGPVFRDGCRIAVIRGCWVTFKYCQEQSGDSHFGNNYFRLLININK